MKRLLLVAIYAWLCCQDSVAQTSTACSKNGTFTIASVGSTLDNRLNLTPGCVQWRLSYYSTGFSALSIAVQTAPDVSGVPGSWSDVSSTFVTQGSNPSTALSGEVALQFYFPWVRVNVSTVTGSGTITYQLTGVNAALIVSRPPGSGGSGGVTSFNARTGVVIPAANDYDFSQVAGATSTEHYNIGPSGQMQSSGSGYVEANRIRNYTVANLPASTAGRIAYVTDGLTTSDCSSGGGAFKVLCWADGSSWSFINIGTRQYQTVQDEGSNLTQRQTLNFTGAGVTCADDAGNSRTNCTISGGGGGGNTITTGTLASLGAASTAGDMFVTTDSLFTMLISNGATWDYFIGGKKLGIKPATTSVNLAAVNATVTTYGSGVRLDWTGATNFNTGAVVKAPASSTFTFTIGVVQNFRPVTGAGGCGLILAKSTTVTDPITNFATIPVSGGGLGQSFPNIQAWTGYNTGVTSTTVLNNAGIIPQTSYPIYFRVTEDASNRTYYISQDNGVTFQQVAQEAVNTRFTTGEIGFSYFAGNSGTIPGSCTLVSWEEA